MTPHELKSSILQLAVQGRLVEQRPEEGTAEELYRQIQEEKQCLIKEGKIKKEKPLPEITEDEIPFDIPESWKWVRVYHIAYLTSGNQYKEETSGIPFVKVADMNLKENEYEILTSSRFVSSDNAGRISVSSIVFPKRGGAISTNKKRLVRKTEIYIDSNTMGMTMIIPSTLKYVKHWFDSIDLGKIQSGTSVPQINNKDIYPMLIPLPPLAEQKRIVAKIEELLPYIDRYEKAWSKLDDFNKRFPGDMQKSVLQMAIQGKLVEQRPEEGTTEELYQQIQAEKQRLIKEGKIKKEKTLPEITEDEIPFDIPESWKWTRLGNITDKLTDGSHNPPPNTGVGYPVISAKNVKNGLISFENVDRYTDKAGFDKENPRTNISYGDIIMGIIGGSIGNIGIYLHNEKVIAQRSIAIIHTLINSDYLMIILRCPYIQNLMRAVAAGSAQGGVYLGTLKKLLIPLPPLAEQKRIVEKLDEILPLCENLK